ncbi:MAG: DUF4097 domain-containing protein [Acidobacteriota bacterium]|nr:DUF4097 domain-containing protein [Acidobacteriota bacterium]
MITKRRLLVPAFAALLLAAPIPARAQGDATVIRDASRAVSDAGRAVSRAVTRYQGRREDARFEQTDRQTKTVPLGPAGFLALHNIAGDITITAGGGDNATIEIIKVARGSSDADAKELLGLVPVEIIERKGSNRVEVVARYPEHRGGRGGRRNFNVTTTYRVVAPAGTRIKTDSISGSITVSGIRGELTLGTISGNLRIQDAGRVVNGSTISGNVELVSVQNDAVVNLSSTSGNVTARGLRVQKIDLGSISGSVRGQDLHSNSANLHTMSGNVEYSGTLTSGGRYEFRSHSGDVRLTFGSGVGFEIEASTFSGEVRSGLALQLSQGGGGGRNRTIRGTFGDGKARIEAGSFSGNVVINGR